MNKVWIIILTTLTIVCFYEEAKAGVRFITDVPQNTIHDKKSSNSYTSPKIKCSSAGYTKTIDSCGKDKVAVLPCPYNPTYYKECCAPEYKYSKNFCYKKGKKPSKKSCAGLYACE